MLLDPTFDIFVSNLINYLSMFPHDILCSGIEIEKDLHF